MIDKFSSAKEFAVHIKSLYFKSPKTVSPEELKIDISTKVHQCSALCSGISSL